MDALAQKAFEWKKIRRRLPLKPQVAFAWTKQPKMRKNCAALIIKRLTNCYLMVAIFSWLLVSAAWFLIAANRIC